MRSLTGETNRKEAISESSVQPLARRAGFTRISASQGRRGISCVSWVEPRNRRLAVAREMAQTYGAGERKKYC